MKRAKVLFAYCHELGRSLSIDQARVEYFSKKPEERKRFTFSCSDRSCGVLISGVNYHVMAEDGVKYQAAHYRSPHEHQPGCEWTQFTDDMESVDVSDDEFRHERKARKKLKDYVNHFTPWTESVNDVEVKSDELRASEGVSVSSARNHESRSPKNHNRWQRYTKTNQLQRLIDTWQDAKMNLSNDEYLQLKLHVESYGQIPLHHYVTHIRRGLTNPCEGVIYGGTTLMKRYGRGFLLQFFDHHDDKKIRLYVSKDIMDSGKTGHYVDEILNTEDVKYFQVFLLNPSASERENAQGETIITLNISDLRQLVVYYKLNTKTSAESESEGNCGDKCA